MEVEYRPTAEVIPYSKNAKKHPDKQVKQIADSITAFGFRQPIVVDKEGVVIVGHGRLAAAMLLGMETVPITVADLSEGQAKAYRLADNQLNALSDFDMELVVEELKGLTMDEVDLTGFDRSLLLDTRYGEGHPSLSDRFGAPPFSVLNARSGEWQTRKKDWLSMGIKSEVGRDIAPTSVSADAPAYMADRGNNEGGSIFDPVVCELMYRWFCPENGTILDPFAGGSVRGIIASKMNHQYTGVELRGEQVEANRQQATELTDTNVPTWIQGDSNEAIPTDVMYDMVFSCPPYADLEVYSDDPADLSNMDYEQFIEVYRSIITKAVAQLRDGRFAVFVVGEIRDAHGYYRNFVGDTVRAFIDARAQLYNEAILVTAIGSLPVRTARAFNAGRKLGKTHQNILVFYKGDPRSIKDSYGIVDISGIEEDETFE